MLDKLRSIREHYDELTELLTKPEVLETPDGWENGLDCDRILEQDGTEASLWGGSLAVKSQLAGFVPTTHVAESDPRDLPRQGFA